MAVSGGSLLMAATWRIAGSAMRKVSRAIQSNGINPATHIDHLVKGVSRQNLRAPWLQQRGYSQATPFAAAKRAISNIARSSNQPLRSGRIQSSRTQRAAPKGRTAFATTLRPNLTGGCMPRTAGGYGTGAGRINGMRHFSSSPAASADVINNVSAAMRAFWLSGQRAAHDGRHRKGGPARFKTVPVKAKDTKQTPFRPTRRTPGSYVEFDLQPHPLALAMATSEEQTLGNAGFLADLEAGLQQHAAAYKRVLADLKLLQSIGSLPLSAPDATHVRVHFPGTDWEHVERLCLDLGLQHGVVYEEIEPGRGSYEPLALRFPPVPGDVDGYHEVTHGTLPHRYHSMDSWISAIAPHSLPGSVLSDDTTVTQLCDTGPVPGFPSDLSALESDFEGFEGIYRFLEQLDHAAEIRIPHP